ncbi:MAG TPA: hypothetical protein VGH28_25755 [Polyangiaceae bacterium]|jgi:hypothetical protein
MSRRFFFSCLLATTFACGGSIYMPSRAANFEPDGETQIDDHDVQKAFEAKPQWNEHFNVAYFDFDASKDADVDKALRAVPGVGAVYSIPALEATGHHRFDETPTSAPLGMKKLRLLAARAHCDLLVVVDYARKTDVSANALAAFDVLIVPALFLPFRDVTVESAVDAFVVDVRNGYLYGHVSLSKKDVAPHQTIYADDDALAARQWSAISAELKDALVALATSERRGASAGANVGGT